MKKLVYTAILAFSLSACNNQDNKKVEEKNQDSLEQLEQSEDKKVDQMLKAQDSMEKAIMEKYK